MGDSRFGRWATLALVSLPAAATVRFVSIIVIVAEGAGCVGGAGCGGTAARANVGDSKTPQGYRELLDAARRATKEGRVLVALSGQHLFEMTAINDPRQRRDVADVMEELSGFQYLLGRPEIARLEIEAGIEAVPDEAETPEHLPLIGPSFGWGFGMRGGLKISNERGVREEGEAGLRDPAGRPELMSYFLFGPGTASPRLACVATNSRCRPSARSGPSSRPG